MRLTKLVELGEGISVTVKELTVAEVRAWLLEGERAKGHKPSAAESVGILFFEGDTALQDLAYMCGMKLSDFDDFTPSQIDKIMEVCKSLNPPFFRIQEEMARTYQAAKAANASLPKS